MELISGDSDRPLLCIGSVDRLTKSLSSARNPDNTVVKTDGALIGAGDRSKAGNALLLHALARRHGGRPEEHVVSRDARGRPIHLGGDSVSISHSGPWAACAVATGCLVGMDIQVIDARRDVMRIAEAFFSPEENHWLKSQPRESFYQLFTLKEAYLKALGLGIAGGLQRISCTIECGQIMASTASAGTVGLHLYGGDDFFCAVALVGGGLTEPIDLRFVRPGSWQGGAVSRVACGSNIGKSWGGREAGTIRTVSNA